MFKIVSFGKSLKIFRTNFEKSEVQVYIFIFVYIMSLSTVIERWQILHIIRYVILGCRYSQASSHVRLRCGLLVYLSVSIYLTKIS